MSSDMAIRELRESMNRLRGRLFQTIESFGLQERQELAAKGVIRQMTYDAQANVEATIRRNGSET